ncbi:hypothetical protein EYF80_053164 [Liparis tanakae]|uniref:Uncharacterized protein n=1 Tax=Liparis tanakae TaxID=230148 RepID=A0A4Z2F664_9TELE|nr:hypothetical protein EYF80_053164 [Liparis tanakae]
MINAALQRCREPAAPPGGGGGPRLGLNPGVNGVVVWEINQPLLCRETDVCRCDSTVTAKHERHKPGTVEATAPVINTYL